MPKKNLRGFCAVSIISQEYFLGDPLPELLKPFRSDEPELKTEKPLNDFLLTSERILK